MSFTNIWMAVRPTRISEPNNPDNGEANGDSESRCPYAIDPNGEYNKIPGQSLNSLEHPLHPGSDLYSVAAANPFVVFEIDRHQYRRAGL